MLSQTSIERILTAALSVGGDFSEVFIQHKKSSGVALLNGVVESTTSSIDCGIGIRILEGDKCVYVYSNDVNNEEKLLRMACSASSSLKEAEPGRTVYVPDRADIPDTF